MSTVIPWESIDTRVPTCSPPGMWSFSFPRRSVLLHGKPVPVDGTPGGPAPGAGELQLREGLPFFDKVLNRAVAQAEVLPPGGLVLPAVPVQHVRPAATSPAVRRSSLRPESGTSPAIISASALVMSCRSVSASDASPSRTAGGPSPRPASTISRRIPSSQLRRWYVETQSSGCRTRPPPCARHG